MFRPEKDPETREEALHQLRKSWEVEVMSRIDFAKEKLFLPMLAMFFLIVPFVLIELYSKPEDGAILGFWGSYLGGIITLIALIVAISSERKRLAQSRKEFALQVEIEAIKKDMENVPKHVEAVQDILKDMRFDYTGDSFLFLLAQLSRMVASSNSKRFKHLASMPIRKIMTIVDDCKARGLKGTDKVETIEMNQAVFALGTFRDLLLRLNISQAEWMFD